MVYRSKTLYDESPRKGLPSTWSRTIKRRGAAVFLIGVSFWLLIVSRLFYFQILKAEEYKKIASIQHQLHFKLEAKRGLIYDRNGELLTLNLPVESFFAIPESVKNINLVASIPFGSSGPAYRKLAHSLKTDSNFVWLKRKVEKKESQRIKSLLDEKNLKGVWVLNETKRYYLNGDVGKDVLGFTNIDNKGSAGVEFQYNQELSGKDGEAIFQRDGHKNSYQLTEYPIQKPESGKNMGLTIDIELQSIIEEELEKGISLTRADGGSAVFVDPKTGEILAMTYCDTDDDLSLKNRVINDNFEPGSTFKIVTAASALEERILTPEDKIYAEKGEFRFGKRTIHDVKSYEWLTFRESVIFSSNIALAKIASKVGKEKIYKYARDFGFGTKTGIDLPGESKGFVSPPEKWSDFTLCTIGFGQGISLTALQLVCAYAAVANGGVLMKPFVVKAVMDEKGDTLQVFHPTPVRRVISPETASTLVEFLKGVVSYGSGQKAKIDSFDIAGKTGTAQKAKPGGKGYEDNKYMASFVGFFPADDPKMVGLITLDNPKTVHLGGQTAAPIFKNTTVRILALTGEPFREGREENSSMLASYEESSNGSSRNSSLNSEKSSGKEKLECSPLGEPYENPLYCKSSQVKLKLDTPALEESSFVLKSEPSLSETLSVPNVLGMTAREALRVLSAQNLQVKLLGSGLVTKQTLEPGTSSDEKQICVIECSPK
jgi:cell division protein FtsI (penicillin-binding protein 3)